MSLTPELQELLYQIVLAVVTFVAAVLGYYIRSYLLQLKAKVETEIGSKQLAWLTEFVEQAVNSAFQNPALQGIDKVKIKEFVLGQCMEFVEKNKLPFTRAQVDLLIESAVYWAKKIE